MEINVNVVMTNGNVIVLENVKGYARHKQEVGDVIDEKIDSFCYAVVRGLYRQGEVDADYLDISMCILSRKIVKAVYGF